MNHLQKVSRSLGNAVDSFNAAVGSIERNVLPQARKFTELGVTSETLPPIDPIEQLVRAARGRNRDRDRRTTATPPRPEADEKLDACTTIAFDPRAHQPAPDELQRPRRAWSPAPARGIGRAVSLALARAGAEVILLGRTVRKLEGVHAEIQQLGGAGSQHRAARSRARARGGLRSRRGRDRRSATAGSTDCCTTPRCSARSRPSSSTTCPTFMRVMHVNVTAAFVLTQHLLPLLRASPDAAVLFTSSGVGKRGRAYWGAYSISKFAVEGMTQVLAHETEGNDADPREHHRSGQGAHRDAPPGLSVRGAGIAADARIADRALPRLVRPGEPRRHGQALRGARQMQRSELALRSAQRGNSLCAHAAGSPVRDADDNARGNLLRHRSSTLK